MKNVNLLRAIIFLVPLLTYCQKTFGDLDSDKRRKSAAQWRFSRGTSKQFTGDKDAKESQEFNRIISENAETSAKLLEQENVTIPDPRKKDKESDASKEGEEAPKDGDDAPKEEESGEGESREIKSIRDLKLSDIQYDKSEMKQVLAAGGGMTAMAGIQMALGELIGTAPGEKDPKAGSWKKEELKINEKDLLLRDPKQRFAKESDGNIPIAPKDSVKAKKSAPADQWYSGDKDPKKIKERAIAEGIYKNMPLSTFEE